MGQQYLSPEEHAKKIKEKGEEFYQAIYDANADGLNVNHEVLEYQAMGDRAKTPKLSVEIVETPRSWRV